MLRAITWEPIIFTLLFGAISDWFYGIIWFCCLCEFMQTHKLFHKDKWFIGIDYRPSLSKKLIWLRYELVSLFRNDFKDIFSLCSFFSRKFSRLQWRKNLSKFQKPQPTSDFTWNFKFQCVKCLAKIIKIKYFR